MRSAGPRLFRLAILAVGLLCSSRARAADAEVYLFLQPLPAQALGLSFAAASVSVVAADGTEYPLAIRSSRMRREEAGNQRLLGSGRVPPGSYTGFAVRIAQATLRSGRDDRRLTVPDSAVRIAYQFVVSDPRATVVWLTLEYEASVGDGPAFSPVFLALPPPTPIAEHAGFVTNSRSDTITMFDRMTGQVVAVLTSCDEPGGLALDERRRRLYVACSRDDEIDAIDVITGEVIARSHLLPGDRPRELALTDDGAMLLSANAGSSSVNVFDALSLAREDRISVGNGPGAIVLAPSGRRAVVLNTLSNSLSILDVADRRVVATLGTDAAPIRAQFGVGGDRLYVVHDRSPWMTVLDAAQLTLVTRVRLRAGVDALAVDTVRNLVCLASADEGSVDFYDRSALMPVLSMRIPAGASYLVFNVDDNSLYMVHARERRVGAARVATRQVAWEIDVGDAPYAVAVMGGR
jgi:DNA-binding beta-propeller fold protein YncE